MKIPFACPSCAAAGSVDASAAGRSARCRHCGHRFTIPTPGPTPADAEPDEIFPLAAPAVAGVAAGAPDGGGYALIDPIPESTFVPTRGHERHARAPRRSRPPASESAPRPAARRRASRSAWPRRLAWSAGAVTIALSAIALFAPGGVLIAACVVMAIGCAMILTGYAVGAYGAFSEDFLYGFLYLVIPLYSAYYLVTRWDDLWLWAACMTVGVGVVLLGIEMARWGGVVA